ncbi:MAG: YifB family Mg chelatase-like AAA ATPase [Candidatus Pacebacteria bacterium]|nr:YifB family Mg chelatase-like AAA ATPase [Candidatus Paceibacterota bacterium]
MSFSKVYSAQNSLLSAHIITVETDLSRGLHSFTVVGLPDKAVEESRDRMSAAIKNSGWKSPKSKNQKITISLAPADIKKEGPLFDLPMALAYLLASDEISFSPEKKIFLGELTLDGKIRKVNGVLPIVMEAKKSGFADIFVPKENAKEAAIIEGINIFGVTSLSEVVNHLNEAEEKSARKLLLPLTKTEIVFTKNPHGINFDDINGQESAKRGLEIAAAGGHNIAMYGPPGTGKTMLAKAFCHILPPLSLEEIFETTSIHSVAGILKNDLLTRSPFRSPHHTSSYVSLIGGGAIPKPGEVTLAHNGVLFLDEFPEFESRVLEALREPLEERVVSISRARGTAQFPARFILIAAMNPCPCGFYGVSGKNCVCNSQDILRYKRKVSGPIVDRIDMWVEVSNIDHKSLMDKNKKNKERADVIQARVQKARDIQSHRFKKQGLNILTNSEMNSRNLVELIRLSPDVKHTLDKSAQSFGLSPRAYHRIVKLSRTIADLYETEEIENGHLLEALQYRHKQER